MTALILLCQPTKTKALIIWAKDLYPGAFWTPTLQRKRRLPRSRKIVTFTNLAMPGYLFLRGDAPGEALVKAQTKGARPLWTPQGQYSTCKLSDLAAMQQFLLNTPRSAAHVASDPELGPRSQKFEPGDKVWVLSGPLYGMSGEVVRQKQEEVAIKTGTYWGALKISSFLLGKEQPI